MGSSVRHLRVYFAVDLEEGFMWVVDANNETMTVLASASVDTPAYGDM